MRKANKQNVFLRTLSHRFNAKCTKIRSVRNCVRSVRFDAFQLATNMCRTHPQHLNGALHHWYLFIQSHAARQPLLICMHISSYYILMLLYSYKTVRQCIDPLAAFYERVAILYRMRLTEVVAIDSI